MNNKNDVLALTIESDTFNGLKTDFDHVLRKTLKNMEQKDSEQAELTLKLKISLEKDSVPDFSKSDDTMRNIVCPTFAHKISSVMQIKCVKNGEFGGDYELVWDEEAGDYVMRPIDDGQGSLFDEKEDTIEPLYLGEGKEEQPPAEPLCLGEGVQMDVADVIEAKVFDMNGEEIPTDYDYCE